MDARVKPAHDSEEIERAPRPATGSGRAASHTTFISKALILSLSKDEDAAAAPC
jgi:hypothetical protein